MALTGKSAIPTGMASMLKMFGVDPGEIMKSIEVFGRAVKELDERLARIEMRLARIEGRLGLTEEGESNGSRGRIDATGNGSSGSRAS